ncbi:hypothetical protein [Nitrospirillum pindoramense]|uniref:DUF2069 domain-containing protein n=1 Tax=Nitrospirillum amazonense TaxID=28077 RepID=A0A560HAY6_9PROT|nr:hypothetical protein [Nitrospirillum amazonense]TWB43281.1 hypothetical protein FBZ90_10594 [Nitrospirillum amazonense]
MRRRSAAKHNSKGGGPGDTALDHWQRLRKDRLSNAAAIAAVLSMVAALLSWLNVLFTGPLPQTRGNPLYWALMIPCAWWASDLTRFRPGAVIVMRFMFIMAPLLASITLLQSEDTRPDSILAPAILFALACTMATVGALCYRRSLLRREGPSRLRR